MFERSSYVLQLENFLTAAMESSSPWKEPNCMLLRQHKLSLKGMLVPVSTSTFPLPGCLYRLWREVFEWSICCSYRWYSRGVIFCCWRKNAWTGEGLCLFTLSSPHPQCAHFFPLQVQFAIKNVNIVGLSILFLHKLCTFRCWIDFWCFSPIRFLYYCTNFNYSLLAKL